MSTRFNPPPGWSLVGVGELPPADWTPDASLPPAPTGWPFYLDPRGDATPPPAGAWLPVQPTVESPVVAAPTPAPTPAPTAAPTAAPTPAPGRHRSRPTGVQAVPVIAWLVLAAILLVVLLGALVLRLT